MEEKSEGTVIQFAPPSNRPSRSSRRVTPKPAGKGPAAQACQMILSCYPDFGKAPPEYAVNLIDLLATYPEKTLVAFCDLRTGVASRCPYLPTIADIVKLGEAVELAEDYEQGQREKERAEKADREAFEKYMGERREKYEAMKAKHPTACIGSLGEILVFKDLEKEGKLPTASQVDFALRINRLRPPYPWQDQERTA